ncbi:hypothetical protein OsI_15246 [Oryza sativa Indica Group]|uniref:Uncharacterized protein n=1 Tax=Oryza sativa subsp. indica TaxID=39946 RepID=A2XRI7_ORYSI|nr:hypothetical protein OsI_15246 [Oryza sativa Indica Group]
MSCLEGRGSPKKKKAVVKKCTVRLTSRQSPLKPIDLSWVPDRMDCSLACRVCIRVGPYVVFTKNGRPEYHKDIKWIVDKDTVCWIDLMSDLDDEVIHSPQQELNVKFWDKNANRYEQVASDRSLLDAFDMYWEMSRLPLIVDVSDDTRNRTEPCLEQGNTEPQDVCTDIVLFTQQSQVGQSSMPCTKPKKGSTYKTVDAWGVNDEVEDVSVDDEKDNYKDLVSDDEELDPDYEPGSDEDVVDLAEMTSRVVNL